MAVPPVANGRRRGRACHPYHRVPPACIDVTVAFPSTSPLSTLPSRRRGPGVQRCVWYWLLLGLWWSFGATEAQPVFEVPAQAASTPLTDELEYFIDETGRWRPESGETPPSDWQPLRERRLNQGNFGFVPHPIWFRLTLRSAHPMERVWAVGTPQLEWVEWALVREGRNLERSDAGLGPTQTQRLNAPPRVPAIALSLGANEPLTVFMRVQTLGLMQVPVDLWEPSAWREYERRAHALLGAFFGLLVGLLAYNGFLALRLRDPAYAHYIVFGIGLCVFQLGSTGFGPAFLWPAHALATYTVLSLMSTVMGAAGLLFTDSFLRVWRFSPRLSRVLRISAFAWFLVTLGHLWMPAHWMTSWFVLPLGLWTVVAIMTAGTRGWLHRAPAAVYFMLGWSTLAVAIVLRSSLRMGLLPPHPLLYNGMLVASALEMLVLSLALADRVAAERRARAEADLQRAREQAAREKAQHALAEKSRFMAAITHDLQQPLYALNLATESVARQGTERLSPQALNQMRSALSSADELMASLAMNVRLDRDNLLPEFEVFSVQDMLERVDTLFASRAQQAGLRWRVLPSLAQVHSDPLMLERMVCNLVSNAMRYTQEGGVLLSCRLRAGHLLIQVWDTGSGIAESERSAIFEAYQRGSAAQSNDEGLGLGLSIVSRCASLLGIRVDLGSVPGRGSCFSLWVPLAPA